MVCGAVVSATRRRGRLDAVSQAPSAEVGDFGLDWRDGNMRQRPRGAALDRRSLPVELASHLSDRLGDVACDPHGRVLCGYHTHR